MSERYSDNLRAQVIAEWQLGTPKARIARNLKVSRGYVQMLTRDIAAQAVISPENQQSLGVLIYEVCIELARGASAIGRKFQDAGWLQEQSAEGLAIGMGVAIDKLAGLVGAMQRGQSEREDGQLPVRAGVLPD